MSWRSPSNLAFLEALEGARHCQPLSRFTSFNIGGPAEYMVEARQVAPLLQACHERGIPAFVLGAGTNLLIADRGIEGLVVRCVDRGCRVEGDRVRAAAGLKMLRLARLCSDHDLTGFEWAIGVPGTVGGAVYQNAGCWGGQLSDVLEEVEGFMPGTGEMVWPPAELELGYRTSALRRGALRGALVLAAWIRLAPGDGAAGRRRMAEWTELRTSTQPIKTKNCGSVFTNPPGDSAGRLIQAAGLKGAAEGPAQISEQHANFIVNRGGASAADVDRLIRRAQETVMERFGVHLEPEVERVGSW